MNITLGNIGQLFLETSDHYDNYYRNRRNGPGVRTLSNMEMIKDGEMFLDYANVYFDLMYYNVCLRDIDENRKPRIIKIITDLKSKEKELKDKWRIHRYYGPNYKKKTLLIKTISQDEINEDVCGICLENHAKTDSVETCCEHHFGKTCFQSWTDTRKENGQQVYCPMCKKELNQISKDYNK